MKLPNLTHRVSIRSFGGTESPEAGKEAFIRRAYLPSPAGRRSRSSAKRGKKIPFLKAPSQQGLGSEYESELLQSRR
jgi:hypothetical protein